jgi:signal transduction histidine kinase/DNA-binding response OmpR family regulator
VENNDRHADRASILIVDDLAEKLLVLETVLAALDSEIVTARSGEEALRMVLEHDFAVILLDINMPGMDGLETAAYIRRRKKSAHTPIIFLTAYADEAHTARGYSLGAVDYIFTPFVPEVLRTKVKVFVDLYRMTQQVRRQADERVALAHAQAARAAAEEATRRVAFLAEAGTVFSSTLDFETALRALAQHLVPTLADMGAVHRVDEKKRPELAALTWIGPDQSVRSSKIADGAGPLAGLLDVIRRCLDSAQPIHLLDAGPWPTLPAAPEIPHVLRSVAVVPLVARGRTLGVMTLAFGPSGRSHSPADLALAGDLAARAAIALDNARLYQNIQQEDERKNQFLAMLAHELRNPLAPIRNAVHVLKLLGAGEPALMQARDMIDRQVTHMARLVDDLLDTSRLARGKILLRKERLDLVCLVRDTLDDYRGLLTQSGLTLETVLPEVPIFVDGDATRLSQVLGNVLHNASKFTDVGGRVTVALTEDKETGSALLRVSDTGIGMERGMLESLFDAFSQADSSLDRSRGGLGLGLAVVRGLVRLHGGDVSAESGGLNQGTAISIRLPLCDNAELSGTPSVPGFDTPPVDRVLLIEDNPDTAESLRLLLAMTGHEVEVAHAGPAGVAAARAFRPQVVVCDIGLPGGMDGYAVARTLRCDPALASVRLIALSGYGQDEDRRRAREAGFDAHLIKPVDFAELRRLITIPDSVRESLLACDR